MSMLLRACFSFAPPLWPSPVPQVSSHVYSYSAQLLTHGDRCTTVESSLGILLCPCHVAVLHMGFCLRSMSTLLLPRYLLLIVFQLAARCPQLPLPDSLRYL